MDQKRPQSQSHFKIGLEGITASDFVEILLHRELADSGHLLSNKRSALDYGKVEPAKGQQ